MNKIPHYLANDMGIKIAMNQGTIPRNTPDLEAGVNPIEVFEDTLHDSSLLLYKHEREHLDLGMGQPAKPELLNLSTGEIAHFFLTLAQQIKFESGEVVGITRNRAGQNKASETAYGIQQGVQYSEAQTEKYFENHYQLMKRVRQRMLDAAQYYSTFKESAREVYLNEKEETTLLQMEGLKNLLPHYQINIETTAKTRSLLNMLNQFLVQENTLPFKPGEKIKALVSNSVPQIVELIEKSEIEQYLREKEQRQHELDMQQQQAEAQQKLEDTITQRQQMHDEAMAASAREVAEIRALGGLQSDQNGDGQLDAQQNLENMLKQRQLDQQNQHKQMDMDQKEAEHNDNVFLKNKEIDAKLKDTQTKLQIAKTNKNKYDSKGKK